MGRHGLGRIIKECVEDVEGDEDVRCGNSSEDL